MFESEISLSVLDVIAQRRKQESKPQHRDDPFKVGLVIEGGAMRGVVSGGMVSGLQALGLKDAFDSTYSCSAGSAAAAYFIADQAPLGTSIYYEDLTENFIDIDRPLRGMPVVDIPFLAYDVMLWRKRLDWQEVAFSPVANHIYVTSAREAVPVDQSGFEDRTSLHDVLHWTCRIPVWAGMPVQVGQNYWTDGAVSTGGIPFQQAIDDGCSHILVLLTRPEGQFKSNTPSEFIASSLLWIDGFKELALRYWSESNNSNRIRESIAFHEGNVNSKPRVEAVQLPTGSKKIASLETRREILRNAALGGYDAVIRKFSNRGIPINGSISII